MAEGKKSGSQTGKPGGSPATPPSPTPPPAAGQSAETETEKSGRKAWVKKTPIEHVLEQIGKQEERVNGLREELKKEERELAKLQQAKKVLEATD
jgi:hypothetical protein